MCCSFADPRWNESVSPRETRVLELFYTPIPSRGFGMHLNITQEVYAQVLRTALLRSTRRTPHLSGSRPHYAEHF